MFKLIFVTGIPGVGKTYLGTQIRKHFQNYRNAGIPLPKIFELDHFAHWKPDKEEGKVWYLPTVTFDVFAYYVKLRPVVLCGIISNTKELIDYLVHSYIDFQVIILQPEARDEYIKRASERDFRENRSTSKDYGQLFDYFLKYKNGEERWDKFTYLEHFPSTLSLNHSQAYQYIISNINSKY